MVRQDIIAGLRNALQRGISLDQAVKSFISAGYNPADVNEAAKSFQGGTGITQPSEGAPQAAPASQPPAQEGQSVRTPTQTQGAPPTQGTQQPGVQQTQKLSNIRTTPSTNMSRPRGKGMGLIITLVILLISLVGGLVWVILFGQKFLDKILS